MKLRKPLEIIVRNVEEALLAQKYGATRLELIDDFTDGGCSPDLQLTKDVVQAVNIPVNVMVRPHGKGFILDNHHMKQVANQIEFLLTKTSVNGIVFGSLDNNSNINLSQLEVVASLLSGSNVCLTFHRAIDCCDDIISNFKMLLDFYVKFNYPTHLLTSGGFNNANDGISIINEFKSLMIKEEIAIKIIAGSGITIDNISGFINSCDCDEIHLGTGVRDLSMNLSQNKFDAIISKLKQN